MECRGTGGERLAGEEKQGKEWVLEIGAEEEILELKGLRK